MISNKRKVLCKAPSERKDGDRRRSALDLQIRKEEGTQKKKPNKKERERKREKKKGTQKRSLEKQEQKRKNTQTRKMHARTHTNTQSPGLRIQKT
jgi:hypothetical protein